MAGDLGSTQTTNFSNLSVGGNDPNGVAFGQVWAGSAVSAPLGRFSNTSSANTQIGNEFWASGVSASAVTAQVRLAVTGGLSASGVTLDLRTNSVIPSSITYAGGASISGLTIGQWGFVFNASGFSIAFSSGKTAYFFGGSTLSAAIT